MSITEPRPTRKFSFNWAPKSKTLRITFGDGLPRSTKWVGLPSHLVDPRPIYRPKPVTENPRPLNPILPEASGDVSKPLGILLSEDYSIHALTTINDGPLPTIAETPSEEFSDGECAEAPLTPREEAAVEVDSPLKDDLDPLDMVLFSPSDPDQLAMVSHSMYPSSNMVAGDMQEMAPHMGDWVESSSPISCEPLLMVVPSELGTPIAWVEESIDALSRPSKWVNKHMNLFRLQIGVSIKGHESECLAMLMRMDKERKPKLASSCGKKSGTKGVRELKNLASSVNYDARERRRS